MRSLRRPDVVPPTLAHGGSGARRAARNRRERRLDAAATLAFPAHWNKPDVRGALCAMQGWACAYCQAPLRRGDRGDVDHFRPKAGEIEHGHDGYWWLAYDFENYLLSCRACNAERKGARFPIGPGCRACRHRQRGNLSAEVRLLANPVQDPVEIWFQIDCTDPLCAVTVEHEIPWPSLDRVRAEETLRFFALNEDQELVQQRVRQMNAATTALREERRRKLRMMACRHRAHAATVRSLLRRTHPELLPTPEEELDALLRAIHRKLCFALEVLCRGHGASPLYERRARELCWALAVLWKDPPARTSAAIESWLVQAGWKEMVEPLHRALCTALPARRA